MSFLGFDCDGNKIPEERVGDLSHKKVVHESTLVFMIDDYGVRVKIEIHRTCEVFTAFLYKDRIFRWVFKLWSEDGWFEQMMVMYNSVHRVDPPLSTKPPTTPEEQNAAVAAIKRSVVEAFGLLSKACKDFPDRVLEHCLDMCTVTSPFNNDGTYYEDDYHECQAYLHELWCSLRDNTFETKFTITRLLNEKLILDNLISDFNTIRDQ